MAEESAAVSQISIHAPREGGDKTDDDIRPRIRKFQSTPPARGATIFRKSLVYLSIFQSTPPARGATVSLQKIKMQAKISIHAPREGGDTVTGYNVWYTYISIHAPREGGDLVISMRICGLL